MYNFVCLTKCSYGGWITFTSHLARYYNRSVIKVGKRYERFFRDFGYNVKYQNVDIKELLNRDNLLITCIDKTKYWVLDEIEKTHEEVLAADPHMYDCCATQVSIVIHDPTELSKRVLDFLAKDYVKVITIRKTVNKLLLEKYNINNKFLLHPFFEFPKNNNTCQKTKAVSTSRIDFDKYTNIILESNKMSEFPVEIYGSVNGLYAHFKLKDKGFDFYYRGKFAKTDKALIDILQPAKYMVDMSAIKKDGGGSQYSFLEAIYMDCCLVINRQWVEGLETKFIDGVNCYTVGDARELADLLNVNGKVDNIVKNARELLQPHIDVMDMWKPN
jgi:hypothetical protein